MFSDTELKFNNYGATIQCTRLRVPYPRIESTQFLQSNPATHNYF